VNKCCVRSRKSSLPRSETDSHLYQLELAPHHQLPLIHPPFLHQDSKRIQISLLAPNLLLITWQPGEEVVRMMGEQSEAGCSRNPPAAAPAARDETTTQVSGTQPTTKGEGAVIRRKWPPAVGNDDQKLQVKGKAVKAHKVVRRYGSHITLPLLIFH
jgi:hypothetical protein